MKPTDKRILNQLRDQTRAFVQSPFSFSPLVTICRRPVAATRLASAGLVVLVNQDEATLTPSGLAYCGLDIAEVRKALVERINSELRCGWSAATMIRIKDALAEEVSL